MGGLKFSLIFLGEQTEKKTKDVDVFVFGKSKVPGMNYFLRLECISNMMNLILPCS